MAAEKKTYYFSHDANAHYGDEKTVDLQRELGLEGYGAFWVLLELLAVAPEYELEYEPERIAYQLRLDTTKLKHIIEKSRLFVVKDGVFFSKSLKNRLGILDEISVKRAAAADAKWAKYHAKNANAEQKQNKSNANAVQTDAKERKGKESKLNKRKGFKEVHSGQSQKPKRNKADGVPMPEDIKQKFRDAGMLVNFSDDSEGE